MPPWSGRTKVARFLTGLLAATLVASEGRYWSKDTNKQISEDALRTISAQGGLACRANAVAFMHIGSTTIQTGKAP
jgi:hypothetical protein